MEPFLLRRRIARALAILAAHVFPARCFACDRSLSAAQHLGACATCWAGLSVEPRARCRRCALPLDGASAGCLGCTLRPLPLDRTVCAVTYDSLARRFLLRAKSAGRPEILDALAAQLASVIAVSGIANGVDRLASVPSSRLSRWRRGFEPAARLARSLAPACEVPFDARLLRNTGLGHRSSKSQGAAARWARSQQGLAARGGVAGARILLIDDVMTTGATAAACAAALREAGAVEVRAAVWARTPRPGFDRFHDRPL